MKLALTEPQINEIADFLDSGMICYYNKETGEIKYILDSDDYFDDEEDPWAEDRKKIEDNQDQYLEFTGMSSYEAFKVMEDFAGSVDSLELKHLLFGALSRPKPFSNFKWLVETSGPYRQQWFDHKRSAFIRWVEDQIRMHNDMMELEED
ncbi:MAG: UPF0158 family protein [Bacteroidales bacterium]